MYVAESCLILKKLKQKPASMDEKGFEIYSSPVIQKF